MSKNKSEKPRTDATDTPAEAPVAHGFVKVRHPDGRIIVVSAQIAQDRPDLTPVEDAE